MITRLRTLSTFFLLDNGMLRRGTLNPEFQKLVDTLPNLVNAALAPRTTYKYENAWCHWKAFCHENAVRTRPADPFYIAVYVNHLLHTKNSRGSISNAYFGI